MRDREEPYQEDPMAVGRGIVYGLIFGTVMWAAALIVIWFWLYG